MTGVPPMAQLIQEFAALRALEVAFANDLVLSEAQASCALDGDTQCLWPVNALKFIQRPDGEIESIPIADDTMPWPTTVRG